MNRVATNRRPTIEEREDGTKRIVGYAAVFHRSGDQGTEYQLWRDAVERIAPGAFRSALQRRDDVRALFNHDPNQVLGRAQAGTLSLSEDGTGLKYEITPPDTQQARDVMELIRRGDVSGSSFSFRIIKEQWTDEGTREIRTIQDVELFDVGPVTFPAYEGTTAGARAEGDLSEAKESLRRHHEREQVQRRARLVEVENY